MFFSFNGGGSLFNPLKSESKEIKSPLISVIENDDYSHLPLLDRRIIMPAEYSESQVSDDMATKNESVTTFLNNGLLSIVSKDEQQNFFIVDSYEYDQHTINRYFKKNI